MGHEASSLSLPDSLEVRTDFVASAETSMKWRRQTLSSVILQLKNATQSRSVLLTLQIVEHHLRARTHRSLHKPSVCVSFSHPFSFFISTSPQMASSCAPMRPWWAYFSLDGFTFVFFLAPIVWSRLNLSGEHVRGLMWTPNGPRSCRQGEELVSGGVGERLGGDQGANRGLVRNEGERPYRQSWRVVWDEGWRLRAAHRTKHWPMGDAYCPTSCT